MEEGRAEVEWEEEAGETTPRVSRNAAVPPN